jgi:uncharacterized protein
MVIARDSYLQELIDGKGNGLIKIVTGIRRSGKSFLLFELFHNHLKENGIDDNHIIEVALDDRRFLKLRNPDKMLEYIDEHIRDEKMYYIILDEVQLMESFVDVLNSLLHIRNADVYVTGSNSKFLSKDIATEFRGRGDEIHIYPLSFSEYYSAVGGDKQACWKSYYTYGGLPQLLSLETNLKKEIFLKNLYESVYLKDIIERHKIRNQQEFRELIKVIASSIGSPCNPQKLSNTFKSVKNINIDSKTISSYLSHMEDAFMIEKSVKYDIKGKKYISTLAKYYFQDLGLRNSLLDFRQLEESHIMENVIYNELRSRKFRVDVGMVEVREKDNQNRSLRKQLEVDFVANQGDKRFYIQSALSMPNAEKERQESASLLHIGDTFKRVIIVKDDIMPYHNENGFLIIGLFDFLLNKNALNQ